MYEDDTTRPHEIHYVRYVSDGRLPLVLQMGKLRELVAMSTGRLELNCASNSTSLLIRNSVKLLATASVTEVFVDIIPGYRIRDLSEQEENQKVGWILSMMMTNDDDLP